MDAVQLDTDVFSYLLRRNDARGDVYQKHVKGKTIAVSFITVGELYFGAIRKGWIATTMAALESRLKSAIIIPYDFEICKTYGRLRATLKTESGTDRQVGANDLWIASCAIRHDLPLITNNLKHFLGIPGLKIISEAPKAKQALAKPGDLAFPPLTDPSPR